MEDFEQKVCEEHTHMSSSPGEHPAEGTASKQKTGEVPQARARTRAAPALVRALAPGREHHRRARGGEADLLLEGLLHHHRPGARPTAGRCDRVDRKMPRAAIGQYMIAAVSRSNM